MAWLTQRPYLRLTMALIWLMLTGVYTFSEFVFGFIVATVVVAIFPAPIIPLGRIHFGSIGGFFVWIGKAIWLLLYFLWQVVLANIQVTKLALKPDLKLTPGILEMKLEASSPGQVALLSGMITLTPGTIVMDMDEAEGSIFIHTIDASDPDEALRVPHRFEEMILEVIR